MPRKLKHRKSGGNKQPKRFKVSRGKLVVSLFSIALLLTLILGVVLAYYTKDLPSVEEIARKDIKPAITIYDSKGSILAKYGDHVGETLTYSQIPQSMVNAVIATEDHRFFNHFGVDVWGILRANIVNLRSGRLVQGGSTVTQQLAKILYLSPEKTLKRKIQEFLIALQLEQKFSKEQIMALYLNKVYLGKGNYGIDAAAKYYFGKAAEELDTFEAAILAGMLKAPSRYTPSSNPELSIARARQVLTQMHDLGFIDTQTLNHIKPPHVMERGIGRGALHNPYFADYILSEAQDQLEGVSHDVNIYTTLDLHAQEVLESSASHYYTQMQEKYGVHQIAAVLMEPSGAIKAMLGGTSYKESQFNRAVLAKRQPGSSFKFLVYLTAIEHGLKASDTFIDKPISLSQGRGLPKWEPRNFSRQYSGEMSVEEAFARSINTVAVQISESVGRENVVKMAHRLGIESTIHNLPSVALGASEATVLEMTRAFAHMPNKGFAVKSYAILKITDQNGGILYEHSEPFAEKVLSDDTVDGMRGLLQAVVDNGNGRNARLSFTQSYGKTGTSQDHRDSWFIGFTNDLVLGIWTGNDDSSPTNRSVGGVLPAKIFHDFFEQVGMVEKTAITNDSTPWNNTEGSIFERIFGE